jgi:hypothetical protein
MRKHDNFGLYYTSTKSILAASFLHFVAMPSNVIVLRLDEWSKRLNENDGQEPHLVLKEDLQSVIS